MIPLRLAMRNFICYGEDLPPLDLSQIHVACLVGENGHGKSAILDAMTWALWGKARARSDNELIHHGATDMEVEFEFLLADDRYRVIRKRDKRGRGRSVLEFQIEDDGRFRPLTGESIRETQARIIETLRMDYETFINSACLLQGRADEFTTKPPGERKKILGDILGLSLYDSLEERAKEKAKEKELELAQIRASLGEIERELERKPRYEEELAKAKEDATRWAKRIREEEKELQRLREAKQELDLALSQAEDLARRLGEQEEEMARTEREIALLETRQKGYEETLARKAEIEEGFSSLLTTREANEELNRKLSELTKLVEERNGLKEKVAEVRNELSFQRGLAFERTAQLEAQLEKRAALEEESGSLRQELARLGVLEEGLAKKREEERTLSQEIAGVEANNRGLKEETKLLREKLGLLEKAEAVCPLCAQSLTEVEIGRIRANYNSQGQAKEKRYRENEERIGELRESCKEIQREMAHLEGEIRKMSSLQAREAAVSQALLDIQEAKRSLQKEQEGLEALDARLEERDYAPEEQIRLAELEGIIQSLGYDPQEHRRVRQHLSSLIDYDRAKRELEGARQGMESVVENLERARSAHLRWQKTLSREREKKSALDRRIAALREVTQNLEEQEQILSQIRGEETQARQGLGAAQERLERCRRLEREKEEKSAQKDQLAREKGIYEELRLAFGKKGVQAMIIESVLPELEEEANRLLSRMTEGRMHLRLESQRITKKGEPLETLEIKISDELGPRSYELYSGGEAFRVNFALRIALAKLLARRAGARLETLIIDEGFGTQDAMGRERLVEAINSIQDDFARILVVTHIEELRDAFPVRIEVFKTPQGSQISIT